MSEPEKPLHVRVAEALGWTGTVQAGEWTGEGYWIGAMPPTETGHVRHGVDVPRYDTDWSATGPLIEKHRVSLVAYSDGAWEAVNGHSSETYSRPGGGENVHLKHLGIGATPLLAVCNLLLALHEAGKL